MTMNTKKGNFFTNKKKTNSFDALDITLCVTAVALGISMTAEAVINAVKRAKLEIEEERHFHAMTEKDRAAKLADKTSSNEEV